MPWDAEPSHGDLNQSMSDGSLVQLLLQNHQEVGLDASDFTAQRILKCEKPADLPVQAPAKYKLVINLKAGGATPADGPCHLLPRSLASLMCNRTMSFTSRNRQAPARIGP
jgi:hypothetical protein